MIKSTRQQTIPRKYFFWWDILNIMSISHLSLNVEILVLLLPSCDQQQRWAASTLSMKLTVSACITLHLFSFLTFLQFTLLQLPNLQPSHSLSSLFPKLSSPSKYTNNFFFSLLSGKCSVLACIFTYIDWLADCFLDSHRIITSKLMASNTNSFGVCTFLTQCHTDLYRTSYLRSVPPCQVWLK